ncbi:MAG TPA: hypothetical protein VFN61_06730 [Acidimicrobiales bacterium]|nr:hypothetical protein [Acidimicrobiales bacterium]
MGFMDRLLGRAPGGDPLDERPRLPTHVAYVHWGFERPLAAVEWDITILKDPGSSCGQYVSLLNGSIDGAAFYLGLQTDMSYPPTGQGAGKGLIFSTWWTFDEADIDVAPGGFQEMGTHEGRFVGARQRYPWTVGDYRVSLARRPALSPGPADPDHDWFDLSITPLQASGAPRPVPSGRACWAGGLRFRRRHPDRPATIDPSGLMFAELYSRVDSWRTVPAWHFDVMAYGDGEPCPKGRTEYPAYPFDQRMPNVSAWYDAERRRVRVQMGGVDEQARPDAWRQA